MSGAARIGVLGGTFDPIHYGHLDVVSAARAALSLDDVLLVPSRVQLHKTSSPSASGYHRLAMAALATSADGGLRVSNLELRSPGPSYTSVLLQQLVRAGSNSKQLFFITGADAFVEIAAWHDYPSLLDRSHFIVVSRPGCPASDARLRLPSLVARMHRAGERVVDLTAGAQTAIWLVDAPTRDVSSSEVRRRIARGEPTDGLLPPAIASYIFRHALYGSAPCADNLHDR